MGSNREPRDIERHRLRTAWLQVLAGGGGSAEITQYFWETEHSRRILLIRTLIEEIAGDPTLTAGLPAVGSVLEILQAAQHAAPDAVEALLLDPGVGSSCAYALRRLRGGARSDAPLARDLGALYAFALVAAARAGLGWRTRLPLRDGTVMLPALGLARIPAGTGATFVEAVTDGGRIRLAAGGHDLVVPDGEADVEPDGDGIGWWALRSVRVRGDLPLDVRLDDLDPFRDLADPVPPARLDAEAFAHWTALLTDAWTLLCRDHRSSAETMSHGLVRLAPLKHEPGWDTRSASNGEAFGSVMVSEPPDPVTLAVALVHEYQHITLGGLLHLLPLTEPDARGLHYAPWRDDPRPLAGLIQGVYAFYGIARFWRERARVTSGKDAQQAQFEFAYVRRQFDESVGLALAATGLTAVGREFFTRLRESATDWTADPIEPVVDHLAGLTADSHRVGWRLRHFQPDPADAATLTKGLLTAPEATPSIPGPAHLAVHPRLRWDQRIPAVTRRALDAQNVVPPPRDDVSAGENALVSGDTAAAHAAFLVALEAQAGPGGPPELPSDEEARAWVGLTLSSPDRTAAEALARRPDLVRAVWAEVRTAGHRIPPHDIARWIAPALVTASSGPP
ncbi:HEXXH motif domain-containing protein [Actinoplanes sp. NBRC 103695]|uniref:HEXXH motif domain-containing protein n=1 Tax=Actinoplanes sp. NBRC 103695 TaxID=3032202 RepID=UPI0024A20F4A|nr:HEXXH motif domain-containing protein [Actinoplanes sp. NBRC 103695]GLY99089.1 HEXXH motif domain-containing protein [Actinoplanes sp. NBRC 103695]